MSESITVVVPVDFSECSEVAFDTAVILANGLGASLALCHFVRSPVEVSFPEIVVSPMLMLDLVSGATAQMESYCARAREAGLEVQQHISEGVASNEIVDLAKRLDADLIVMGTHGASGIKHVLLGSVAERTIRTAPCPVLTVKHAPKLDADGSVRLLVPVDFSEHSDAAIQVAKRLALKLGSAHLILLHAQQVPVESYEAAMLDFGKLQREIEAYAVSELAKLRESLRGEGLSVECLTGIGSPASMTNEAATAKKADLIVISTHGRTGLAHLLGSVAERVVQTAPCPVLTVRPGIARG